MSTLESASLIASEEDVTLTIPAADLNDFRLTLREQIAGDAEALRWLGENPDHDSRDQREPHLTEPRLRGRIAFLFGLGDRLGGLYSMALPTVGLLLS